MKCFRCNQEIEYDDDDKRYLKYDCIDCKHEFCIGCFNASMDQCHYCYNDWEANLKYRK